MKKHKSSIMLLLFVAIITGVIFLIYARENYSNGEKTGTIASFTKSGSLFKF